jgi:hypothetical protein
MITSLIDVVMNSAAKLPKTIVKMILILQAKTNLAVSE